MTARPGYDCGLYIGGTPTTFTAEATTSLGSDAYQVTDADKRIWDPNTAIVVNDNGSPVDAADIEELDFLFGIVTFVSGYSPLGAITVTGKYLPLFEVADAHQVGDDAEAVKLKTSKFRRGAPRAFHDYIHGIRSLVLTANVRAKHSTNPITAPAVASGTITFGTPSNGDTVIVTGPDGGPYTFTKADNSPGNNFANATALANKISDVDGLTATNDSGTITVTVDDPGTDPNSWTITGTGTFSALSITFSGGLNYSWDYLAESGEAFLFERSVGEPKAHILRAWVRCFGRGSQDSFDGLLENNVSLEGVILPTQNVGHKVAHKQRTT